MELNCYTSGLGFYGCPSGKGEERGGVDPNNPVYSLADFDFLSISMLLYYTNK
jgi:hypothetical protein